MVTVKNSGNPRHDYWAIYGKRLSRYRRSSRVRSVSAVLGEGCKTRSSTRTLIRKFIIRTETHSASHFPLGLVPARGSRPFFFAVRVRPCLRTVRESRLSSEVRSLSSAVIWTGSPADSPSQRFSCSGERGTCLIYPIVIWWLTPGPPAKNSVRLSTERENEFGDSRPSSEGTLSSKLGTALPPIRPLACSVSSLQFEWGVCLCSRWGRSARRTPQLEL